MNPPPHRKELCTERFTIDEQIEWIAVRFKGCCPYLEAAWRRRGSYVVIRDEVAVRREEESRSGARRRTAPARRSRRRNGNNGWPHIFNYTNHAPDLQPHEFSNDFEGRDILVHIGS